MPTVEERLAALEKQMAAWMDQRPTTYYTHQYSGEEIDNAVGRALTGGALDTSVTNVSNQLGTFVRPNLLDNWYFGNPVDQRGGMLQLAGTMLYSDAACTQALFQSTKTTSIIRVSDIAAHPSDDSTVYVKLADCVRGYVPAWNGYSIDRWSVESDSKVVITFVNGGIRVKNTSNVERQFKQILPIDLNLAGSMITISTLVGDVIGQIGYVLTQVSDPYKNSAACTITKNGLFSASGSVFTGQQKVTFSLSPGAELTILAAKLELGPTQTLAHQDAAGNWVLNEVPEYGEQLARCQRYQFEAFDRTSAGQGYLAQVKAIDSTQAYGVLATPVTMRDGGIPALVTDCSAANPYGAFGIYSMGYSGGAGVITGLILFSRMQNGVILRAVGSNFVAGNDYQIWVDNQAIHQFLLNLNL